LAKKIWQKFGKTVSRQVFEMSLNEIRAQKKVGVALHGKVSPSLQPTTYVLILRVFCQKIGVLFIRNKAKLCKNLIITLVTEKNAIFFAENGRRKSQ
jgi:hypothetical protein